MKKYHFVYSYYCMMPLGHTVGDAVYTSEFYPSRKLLKEYIKEDNPTCSEIIIMGITKMTEKEFEIYET